MESGDPIPLIRPAVLFLAIRCGHPTGAAVSVGLDPVRGGWAEAEIRAIVHPRGLALPLRAFFVGGGTGTLCSLPNGL